MSINYRASYASLLCASPADPGCSGAFPTADGMLARHAALLEQLPFEQVTLPGGHHLHLNDEQGAALVADCINRFFGFA